MPSLSVGSGCRFEKSAPPGSRRSTRMRARGAASGLRVAESLRVAGKVVGYFTGASACPETAAAAGAVCTPGQHQFRLLGIHAPAPPIRPRDPSLRREWNQLKPVSRCNCIVPHIGTHNALRVLGNDSFMVPPPSGAGPSGITDGRSLLGTEGQPPSTSMPLPDGRPVPLAV